jgi:predicted transcriptional regulator
MDTLKNEEDKGGRRVNEKIVKEYLKLLDELPKIIEAYDIKHSYLSKHSQISRTTLLRKLKNKSFEGEEALRLLKAINR